MRPETEPERYRTWTCTNTKNHQLNEYTAYLKRPPAHQWLHSEQTNLTLTLTLTPPPVGPVVFFHTPMNTKVCVSAINVRYT